MRAILVGCGAMSKAWVRCAESFGIEIVALVDINRLVAEECATAFGYTPGFTVT
jgi:predicted dehydrogenase